MTRARVRRLECCCCGSDAGRWQQWYNRDTGYGVCAKCVAWVRSRGESEEEIRANYGVEGVNYAPLSTLREEHLQRVREALEKIKAVRPFNDDDAFNEYAVLQLEKGEEVCGVRLED